MKIKGIVLIALSILVLSACQSPIDVEAEKAAIIKVINDETQAYMDYDYDKVISYFVQDSLNFRLTSGADNHIFMEGWEEIASFFKNDLAQGAADVGTDTHVSVSKENYRIKVYDRSAYVTCTETWTYNTADNVLEISSRQVRFMEKVDGEWKIAFLSFIGTSGYEEEEELEELGAEFNTVL
jgi:hypothetical protein